MTLFLPEHLALRPDSCRVRRTHADGRFQTLTYATYQKRLNRSMGFEDFFRLSVHAVITDAENRVLLLRATYGDGTWGLPGGALDAGETVHEALLRECREELGCEIDVQYLSGIYSHPAVKSQAIIFRCALPADAAVRLSAEHAEMRYFAPVEMSPVQRQRVEDCLGYDGQVVSRRF